MVPFSSIPHSAALAASTHPQLSPGWHVSFAATFRSAQQQLESRRLQRKSKFGAVSRPQLDTSQSPSLTTLAAVGETGTMPPKHKGFNMRSKSGSSANPHRSTDGIKANGGSLRDKVSTLFKRHQGARFEPPEVGGDAAQSVMLPGERMKGEQRVERHGARPDRLFAGGKP